VTCAAGVACQVFYQDADGDGFGNKDGVIGTTAAPSLTAKAGCMGAPPAGYVVDNTDCDDGDPNVNTKQTGFFSTPSLGKHTFDYNCSNTNEIETPVYAGSSCKFCGSPGACATTSTTCSSSGATGSFQCPQEGVYRIPVGPIEPVQTTAATMTPTATAAPTALASMPVVDPTGETPRFVLPPPSCCGCAANDKTGFLVNVACGAVGTTYTCTACSGLGGGTGAGTPTGKVQRCH